MLTEIRPKEAVQASLFSPAPGESRSDKIMSLMDDINGKWGRGAIRVAAVSAEHPWAMRRERKSPNYTTRWDELPVVLAK